MPQSDYVVVEVQREWVLEPEVLGSKRKFWYRKGGDETPWLFKYPQANTGQHWSEKISAEVAEGLGILHAKVELAVFDGIRGSTTESFARGPRYLFHGNQILSGQVLGYDPGKRFGQSDHTLANIFSALEKVFSSPVAARRAEILFAKYLVLDALVGNTDRHHENWGILLKRVGGQWAGIVAPTFDHASSLGRELVDSSKGKCRERLLREKRIGEYAENAPGAIYWEESDARGLGPLQLVRRAAAAYPNSFRPALGCLGRLSPESVMQIVARVPADWMTDLAREFAIQLVCYNYDELRKIRL